MEIVINKCYGGFGLSKAAVLRLRELGSVPAQQYPVEIGETYSDGTILDEITYGRLSMKQNYPNIERNDPLLVQVVREMGDLANGEFAKLRIVEIPDDIEYEIDYYDGMESISEKHRSWG